MKIGYPCINRSIGCTANRTFRLRSYSVQLIKDIVRHNLGCLLATLEYNIGHDIFFFRIGSGLVPFASHPVCSFKWQSYYKKELKAIGVFIKKHNIRISMHPDQFTLINSVDTGVLKRSLAELSYHAAVLEAMALESTAKIQIHVGGVYNDKDKSIKRFIERYKDLPDLIKKHLVVENDDRLYSLKDCLQIHQETGIPVLFDFFHHSLNNNNESPKDYMRLFLETWKKQDGLPMLDYSLQGKGLRRGAHAYSLSVPRFKEFLEKTCAYDFDVMLEIKDKEKSALKAIKAARKDKRFHAKN